MDIMKSKKANQQRRAHRVRARIRGSAVRPRMSVFRSNTRISVQLIDDEAQKTLCAYQEIFGGKVKAKDAQKGVKGAHQAGAAIAKLAKEKGITHAIFDRGRFSYHGQVKAVAEGAREGGLTL
ncbi:50S ribosomal protein L18 [Candidatus Uhrbacteria bacterium RIFCSPLOWO2_02_FULL_49_11]|uniref:Large ribosomal subunit protein uL18 n=1 Tax=Candidatus Uhrbacteria bacterium RIFCSPLOWO2_02_FULL_49_11 TaxID=1802409 RepID=A0A1F7VEE1_9BACT|nr:MAG: 50S ribosomal protein L18 [Candidatus Uhrbacteria bacterium RIFCSPLOWO2_02_FULL_49_11]